MAHPKHFWPSFSPLENFFSLHYCCNFSSSCLKFGYFYSMETKKKYWKSHCTTFFFLDKGQLISNYGGEVEIISKFCGAFILKRCKRPVWQRAFIWNPAFLVECSAGIFKLHFPNYLLCSLINEPVSNPMYSTGLYLCLNIVPLLSWTLSFNKNFHSMFIQVTNENECE